MYVLIAPIFYFDRKVETVGNQTDEYGISVPIPHGVVKNVLTEGKKERLFL